MRIIRFINVLCWAFVASSGRYDNYNKNDGCNCQCDCAPNIKISEECCGSGDDKPMLSSTTEMPPERKTTLRQETTTTRPEPTTTSYCQSRGNLNYTIETATMENLGSGTVNDLHIKIYGELCETGDINLGPQVIDTRKIDHVMEQDVGTVERIDVWLDPAGGSIDIWGFYQFVLKYGSVTWDGYTCRCVVNDQIHTETPDIGE